MVNCPLVSLATSDEILIFSATGKAHLKRDTIFISQLRGEKLLPNDLLELISGTITIINRENKRITITQYGKYTRSQIQKKMNMAEASHSVRYFVMVWENMQQQRGVVNKPGGVIRGDIGNLLPADSMTLLWDSIMFFCKNPLNAALKLTIKSTPEHVPFTCTFHDSTITLGTTQIPMLKPGKYTWEISDGFRKPEIRSIFIPDKTDRETKLADYNKFLNAIKPIEIELHKELLLTYQHVNKIWVNLL